MIDYRYDDGGRAAAGFRGSADDCVVRALAIATGEPYAAVYAELWDRVRRSHRVRDRGKSPRSGVRSAVYEPWLAERGWRWTPTMGIGTGCRTHLRADELPRAIHGEPPLRVIVRCSRHLAVVVDGVLHDTHDSRRGGTRCVYGYWLPEPGPKWYIGD